MENYVEETQRAVFQKYGVDPSRGLQDLRRIPEFYKGDREIMPLLMSSAMREENLLAEALGEKPPSSGNGNNNNNAPGQLSFTDPGFQTRINNLGIPELQNQFEQAQKDTDVTSMY